MNSTPLEYASAGWYVFPCNSIKHPLTPHGHLDASIDHVLITAFWKRYPDALIGVHCRRSGIVVVDIDPRNGGPETLADLESEYGEVPETLAAMTGIQDGVRGKHLYFKAPAGGIELKASLGQGIDVKYNGYVIVPPSPHPSGVCYEWVNADAGIRDLPEWILNRLIKTGVIPRSHRARGDSISDALGLDVREFIMPLNPRTRDGQIEGEHPIHGSTTKSNFVIDPVRNIWYCRRCGTGGGPLEALALSEMLISCGDVGKGCLEGHWAEMFRLLRDRGYDTDLIDQYQHIDISGIMGEADVR